ncbi:MAG: alpha-ketoglutarate-dependent dioxygenase AlkB [Alphaproteobacteria bacterium]|nr:alpha-ketoglutarate-dependent dioxygenase AlkB [Alphaproteobacteria bacterium]
MTHGFAEVLGHAAGANLLPHDGQVSYHGTIMDADMAAHYHNHLLATIPWQQDQAVIFGRRIITARKVAWFGDPGCDYSYSGTIKRATPWTAELLDLKSRVEGAANTTFNACLLNLYDDGSQGMGWHSDNESTLGIDPIIASLSLGAARKFAFRHKTTKQTIAVMLEPGSLLIMRGATQSHWHHSLPKSSRVHHPRINLTFRRIVQSV